MLRALLLLVWLLAACGEDGSPTGTDGGSGGVDSGTASGTDGGSTSGTDSGTVARSDAGADRMCPPAMDTRCGSACTGSETMCLCTCGGGGVDFTPCDCVDGAWDCAECR